MYVYIWQLEDLKGLASGLYNKGVGSIVGACPWCKLLGIRAHGTARYPGVVRLQNPQSFFGQTKRNKFKTEFAKFKDVQDLAFLPAPARTTSSEAITSGREVARAVLGLTKTAAAELTKKESFLDVPVWATSLPNWRNQHLERTVVDPTHCLMHLWVDTADIISQATSKSAMKFTKERRAEEATYGRFTSGKVHFHDVLF